jgi:hypothetical protein
VTAHEELGVLVAELVRVCAGRDLAEQVGWDEEYRSLLGLQELLGEWLEEIVNPWCAGGPERGADGVETQTCQCGCCDGD